MPVFSTSARMSSSARAQEPQLDEAGTVFENVAAGLGDLYALIVDYHHLIAALNDPNTAGAVDLDRMHVLQEQLERRHGWEAQTRIEQVLTRLQLSADVCLPAAHRRSAANRLLAANRLDAGVCCALR